jgi:hypothetical protein
MPAWWLNWKGHLKLFCPSDRRATSELVKLRSLNNWEVRFALKSRHGRPGLSGLKSAQQETSAWERVFLAIPQQAKRKSVSEGAGGAQVSPWGRSPKTKLISSRQAQLQETGTCRPSSHRTGLGTQCCPFGQGKMTFPVAVGCRHLGEQLTFSSRVGEDVSSHAPHETDKSCDNTILGLRWQTLETRCVEYLRIDFATEGANDAQASLFNGSNRNCFHGGICLVAHCARAFPSRHRNVNQSDRYDDELQRLASD